MKLAMHYIYWQRDLRCESYVPFVKKTAELGYGALELGDYLILRMSDADVDTLSAAANEYDIELIMGIDPPQEMALTSFDDVARQKGVAFYTDLMPRLERLGISKLGGNMLNGKAILPFKDNLAKELELGVMSMRQIGKRAAEHGINVNIEVTNRFESHLLTNAARGVEFIKEVDESNVKLLLDTFHMNIEERSIASAVVCTNQHLGHVHIGENHRGLPGTGHINWNEVRDALNAIEYDGVLTMEPLVHAECELGDACKVWNDLTNFADDEKLDSDAAEAAIFVKRVFGKENFNK